MIYKVFCFSFPLIFSVFLLVAIDFLLVALLTPVLKGGKPNFETGVIRAGVNGAGVKFGPALLRPIRYIVLMIKETLPANFSFLSGLKQVVRSNNVILGQVLYKMYRKKLKLANFCINSQKYQLQ